MDIQLTHHVQGQKKRLLDCQCDPMYTSILSVLGDPLMVAQWLGARNFCASTLS